MTKKGNMILHKNDITKIQNILDKFPNISSFEINQDNSSGIGSIVTMTFHHQIEDIQGSFTVEISGIESW